VCSKVGESKPGIGQKIYYESPPIFPGILAAMARKFSCLCSSWVFFLVVVLCVFSSILPPLWLGT